MNTTNRWKAEFLVHRMLVRIKEREILTNQIKSRVITGSPRVLVVEDNRVVQSFITYQFQSLGCDVIVAGNAQTAMELYQPNFHLVLIDLDLPDLPGVTVANWIRRQEMGTDYHLPLIGHTSVVTEETEYRCFVAGMDTTIEKLQNQEECQALLKVWLPQFMQIN